MTEEQMKAIRVVVDFVESVNKKDEDRTVAEANAVLWCMWWDTHTGRNAFMECDTCRAKAGSPTLCNGCLHNRTALENYANLNANPNR